MKEFQTESVIFLNGSMPSICLSKLLNLFAYLCTHSQTYDVQCICNVCILIHKVRMFHMMNGYEWIDGWIDECLSVYLFGYKISSFFQYMHACPLFSILSFISYDILFVAILVIFFFTTNSEYLRKYLVLRVC